MMYICIISKFEVIFNRLDFHKDFRQLKDLMVEFKFDLFVDRQQNIVILLKYGFELIQIWRKSMKI